MEKQIISNIPSADKSFQTMGNLVRGDGGGPLDEPAVAILVYYVLTFHTFVCAGGSQKTTNKKCNKQNLGPEGARVEGRDQFCENRSILVG